MTLTFQGHDLCELTFWAIPQLLLGKTLSVQEFDGSGSFFANDLDLSRL